MAANLSQLQCVNITIVISDKCHKIIGYWIVCSIAYSFMKQMAHQSATLLALSEGQPAGNPHKGQVMQNEFPCQDVVTGSTTYRSWLRHPRHESSHGIPTACGSSQSGCSQIRNSPHHRARWDPNLLRKGRMGKLLHLSYPVNGRRLRLLRSQT